MGWPGETVDAAMLATAIGIDGAVKADIRRLVEGDDLSRRLDGDRSARGFETFVFHPTVVERLALFGLIAASLI